MTGDINEGLKLLGVANAPVVMRSTATPYNSLCRAESYNVGERHSIAADGSIIATKMSINDDLQYANFVKWIKETDVVKPGNLMWRTRLGNGLGQMKDPLTDDEIHKLSVFLQTSSNQLT